MSRNRRDPSGRLALAARMSAEFGHALSEAAATMDSFGVGWDDSGGEEDEGDGDFLALEFQLAAIERAVDSMLLERDRFLYGSARAAPSALATRGGDTVDPGKAR